MLVGLCGLRQVLVRLRLPNLGLLKVNLDAGNEVSLDEWHLLKEFKPRLT